MMKPADRAAAAFARTADGVLDFVVLGFAGWTLVYDACLVFGVGTLAAGVASAALLIPCGWFILRGRARPDTPVKEPEPLFSLPGREILIAAQALAALVAAGVFAFVSVSWALAWAFLAVAAASGLTLTLARGSTRKPHIEVRGEVRWPATLVALCWAAGLAVLSLYLTRSSGDDAYYVHLSAWVAAHGEFPLRDTMFTDQVLPAVIYPPISSVEGLIGAASQALGLQAATMTYLLVPPVASFLAVLSAWRLLRVWRPGFVWLALTVSIAFLLLDGPAAHSLGNLFIGRIWQGKIALQAVLLPLSWVYLTQYLERPGRERLVMLAATGIAGVGLTSSAIFILPLLSFGALVPSALRAARQALTGFAALSAYPLAAGVVVYAVGGRHAQRYTDKGVVSVRIAHDVLGNRWLALVALLAALVGPVVLRRADVARMVAAAVLLVVLLLAPGVPRILFHITGLGAVLWRIVWIIPVATLLGAATTALGIRRRSPLASTLPAIALLTFMIAVGTPIWDAPGPQRLASRPALKLSPTDEHNARLILAGAKPDDVILAPKRTNPAILVLSGTVSTVVARPFYALALRGVPGGHWQDRLILTSFADAGIGHVRHKLQRHVDSVTKDNVTRALRDLEVDLACVKTHAPSALQVLRNAGYTVAFKTGRLTCLRNGGGSP